MAEVIDLIEKQHKNLGQIHNVSILTYNGYPDKIAALSNSLHSLSLLCEYSKLLSSKIRKNNYTTTLIIDRDLTNTQKSIATYRASKEKCVVIDDNLSSATSICKTYAEQMKNLMRDTAEDLLRNNEFKTIITPHLTSGGIHNNIFARDICTIHVKHERVPTKM